ncbi:tetratricopeptide repeat protein [Tumebacillus sp. ITR2]|uniref:Tetratricopeptide repeat protein n=1 Tax=Tumebacillus amylolyticus TaxID=2801339 RepID=A0ABS1JB89_9BACL|nr:tetratricopeptide repeat protein [Tumebacillus amylolyticus]MBL0387542.1 tetratricopeptide repeat protein [Tumebacillus amylolyticus]
MTLAIDERNRLIGENLRKYRLLKGLTQDELAEGLCSVSQLSKVENGKTYLKRTILKEMSNRLGVTVERIESQDALLEELSETLQLAKDSRTAGNIERALEYVVLVVEQSRAFEYPSLLLESLQIQCSLLNQINETEKVIQIVQGVFEENLPMTAEDRLFFHLEYGIAYEYSGHQVAAYDAYCRADQEIDNLQSNFETRFRVYYSLARIHFSMNNHRTALRYFEKAELMATEINRHLWRIRSTYMKATVMRLLGNFEQAEEIFTGTLKEATDNQYLIDVGIINNNMGCMYLEREEYGQAFSHLNRAVKVYEILENHKFLCETLLYLAELKFRTGEYTRTIAYVEQALEVSERAAKQTYQERAKANRILGWVKREQGDFEAYVTQLEKALNIYDDNHVVFEAYEVAKELAEEFYKKSDSRAVEIYRKAVQYNEKALEFGKRR